MMNISDILKKLPKKSVLHGDLASQRSAQLAMTKLEKVRTDLQRAMGEWNEKWQIHGVGKGEYDQQQQIRDREQLVINLMRQLKTDAKAKGWYLRSRTIEHQEWRESVGDRD